MFNPTIILGIGTFGGNVVSHLRTLVYEELGVPGLPIFRFVHISSHEDDEIRPIPSNQESNQLWQSLQIIKATIPTKDISTLEYRMDPDNTLHKVDPGWHEWFDKDILRLPAAAYEAGAGNIRMMGRACLWNKWRKIKPQLRNMMLQINQNEAEAQTNDVLRNYYINKGMDKLAQQNTYVNRGEPRVYIIGSLCGGTGSGMLIDLAHFFKSYPQFAPLNFGIFAVPDMATVNKRGNERLAANCLSALIEIDFFMHNGTRYSAQLPGDDAATVCADIPFNYIQLISPSSRGEGVRPSFTVGNSADPNPETILELSHLCSTSMFFELLGGAQGIKAGIHADYNVRYPDWRKRNPVDPGYLKMFAGFGSATAHYPKYRIAGAAAAKIILTKLIDWSGKTITIDPVTKEETINPKNFDQRKLKRIAEVWLTNAYKQSRSILRTGSKGTGSLRNEWEKEYTNLFLPASTPVSWSAEELRRKLTAQPTKDPFSARFGRNSAYAELLTDRLPQFSDSIYHAIKKIFHAALKGILQARSLTDLPDLAQLEFVLSVMINSVIPKWIDRLPADAVDYVTINQVEPILQEFGEVENSLAIKASMTKDYVRDFYREKAILKYRHALAAAHERLEDVLFREVLMTLKDKFQQDLKGSLSQVANKVEKCISRLEEQFKENSTVHEWKNVLYIFKNAKGGIKKDIQESIQLFSDADWIRVFDAFPDASGSIFDRLMDKKEDYMPFINDLSEKVAQKIMVSMDLEGFEIINELITQNYGNDLTRLAESSDVLTETKSDFNDIFHNDHPHLICGGSNSNLNNLKAHLSRSGNEDFSGVPKTDTEMQHMLNFYQELGGIAIDELKAYPTMKAKYDDAFMSDDFTQRILHTHKDPSSVNIEKYHRFEELKKASGPGKPPLMDIAMEFIQDLMFEYHPPGKMVFEWKEPDSAFEESIQFNPDDPDVFLWGLVEYEHGYREFKDKIRRCLLGLNDQEMMERLGKLRNRTKDEHPNNNKRIKDVMDKYNKAFINKEYLPWWKE
ncbi:tubulin-like doman-containing protein [Desulfobacter latus]|uniref:Tubulin like n=1 Tax=Desulfobacter latus TaxID=2292 RepID=A0A850SXM5_9BACT|nr:tubulin-like doman-containing protein [Desulfobacter latus]NWH05909.1 hypothetical protein [Desulfobacter latus]